MKRIGFILFFLPGINTAMQAQKISNKGTDFWAAFGHHLQMEVKAWFPGDSIKLVFDFSAEQAANVVVTLDGTTYRQDYFVPANSVVTSKKMPLPPNRENGSVYDTWLYTRTSNWPGGTNSEGIFKKKGIHITSDVPIVVFERMYFDASSAATMLFPTDSWGFHYQCLAASQSVADGDGNVPGAFSYFYVIADNDNTKIRINPSVPSRSGLPAKVPFDIVLQKGEVYQFLAGQQNASSMYDVNGTTLTSVANSNGECFPFAAFVGSSATAATCPGQSANGFSLEHLIQQIFPQQAWGKKYVTVPACVDADAFTYNKTTYRVMVKDPATVVKLDGIPMTVLTNGYYEFYTDAAHVVEADQPVQVAQMMRSQAACGFIGRGDPDYMILSPVEQAIKQTRFMRSALQNLDVNYLALTIPTAGLASLKIDGKLNNTTRTYPHPSLPGYSVAIRRWNVRSNTDPRPPAQCVVESDSAFNAYTYGLGQAESYMYNAGTYINNLNGLPFIKNQYKTSDTASPYTCAKTPVELSVLLRYKPTKIFWQLSKLGSDTISPAADVTVNAPVSVETILVNDLPYYRYQLPGTYVFNRPGTYTIPVFASEPTVEQCDHTEQIPYQIEVRDTLLTDFSMLYENCKASELVNFNGRTKFTDSSLVQRWEWTFKNGAASGVASGQNVSYTFNAGNNSANLIAVDLVGCIADTTKTFTLAGKPATPAFTVTSTANCVNNTITFAESTPEAGAQSWFWDFGNGDTSTVFASGQTGSHVYKLYDTLTIRHMVKFSDNCFSDTATQQLIVYANPKLDMSYPVGCLPMDGTIQFTSQVTTPDNQSTKSYLWNFGDPAANAGNPNTSTLASPTHKYAAGNYTVTLAATTTNGCAADSSWNISLQPRPQIQYGPVLAPVCFNTAAPVSVASASISNGIAGTGVYKGNGTDSQGNFNPATASVGNQTIWYVFSSNNGCVDSAASSIWVHAVPTTAFMVASDVCLGEAASFTDQSNIDKTVDVNAAISSWTWNFGDGADQVKSDGQPFDKTYTASGSYAVSLTASSADGCVGNALTKTVNVHAFPVAAFSLPANVCIPGGQALFTNTSTISEAGQLSYQWNYGDGNTGTTIDGSHVYATAQPYTVSLKATSAFGCSHDTSRLLSAAVFHNSPLADFSMDIAKPCEQSVVNFTDNSNGSSGIASWDWSFGDGTKASTKNPSKTYTKFGTYSVSLAVTDSNGCSSVATSNSTKDITVLISPVIDAGPNLTAEENSTVTLKATAANASELLFSWSPAAVLSNATALNPTYVANLDQVFVLTATDKDGACIATDDMKVTVLRPVTVPNAFSPNGDGINDVWAIPNLAGYMNGSVTIFDRYGRQVFFSQGYERPWDGTRNGSPLPVGTYYYLIRIKQNETPLTGSVTIIR